MKRTILALALVACTVGAFAQTPATTKKVAPKTHKMATQKAKKDTVTTTTTKKVKAVKVSKPAKTKQ